VNGLLKNFGNEMLTTNAVDHLFMLPSMKAGTPVMLGQSLTPLRKKQTQRPLFPRLV
jgi:hypothetical protein